MSFHLSRTPILLDVVIMGEHFRAISHNGKKVSLLVNHLIHGFALTKGTNKALFLGHLHPGWVADANKQ